MGLSFTLQATAPDSRARAATFQTLHGEVQTPIFMPVGTQATVKSQTVESLLQSGSRVLLANTYHLMLRPGPEVFRRLGGLHKFMNWNGPILTDSGGFQIFSLPESRRMTEEGASFQSYVDGQTHLVSPESSIAMQRVMGSDIMMVLDQCIPSTAQHAEAKAAMEVTHRWAVRSLQARGDSRQALFGIVQGACFKDLRSQSARFLTELPLDGYAVGGLAVGESKQEREDFTAYTTELLPTHLPRYLMGVGTPIDILEAVHRGVDLFDCVLPVSLAQRGTAFTSLGKLQLRRTAYKYAEEALDPDCTCGTCRVYSRAYLHHLIKAEEVLGWTLLSDHNLTFYHRMMREIRAAILNGTFKAYYEAKRQALGLIDEDYPVVTPSRARATRRENRERLGAYELHESEAGHHSIRHVASGEIMHSSSDPLVESTRLYVEQPRVVERLKEPGELHVWDVGLGAATNAMAALLAVHRAPSTPGRLTITSFENDLDSLKLALRHSGCFPHLHHQAPHELLRTGSWRDASGRVSWRLIEGDFAATAPTAKLPDVVFYDPFSTKTNGDLWSHAFFAKLGQLFRGQSVELYTYTSSTAVRAALLSAGFYVSKGAPTGARPDTTVAYSDPKTAQAAREFGIHPLDSKWLETWSRSHAQSPAGLSESERRVFEDRVRLHPQFGA